jgi:predicted dinucleotide-binding enzyme
MSERYRIGLIGGGNVAQRLGSLFASAGHDVVAGVLRPAGAIAQGVRAVTLAEAAAHGEIVVLAVPFTAVREVLPPLREVLVGKVVVDATNPLNADWSPLDLGAGSSAGEEVARLLPGARVVKSFNTIFADVMAPERLDRGGRLVTAFIAGDAPDACETVALLARSAGLAPLVTGPLRNARYLEAIAHLNIAIAVGQGGGTDAAFLFDQRRG